MTPQGVAEPADEPQAALIATCANCGRRITRLALDSARWRHDDQSVTCAPPDPPFDHLVKGDSA